MPSLSRRRLLELSGTIGVGSVAGCTELQSSGTETYLLDLEAENFDRESHTVYALLMSEGEPVSWESVSVPPYDPETDRIEARQFEEFPLDPELETLYTWRDAQPREAWQEFDISSWEATCLKLRIQIGDSDQESPGEITIWHSANCQNGTYELPPEEERE